jgi:hypothetical protein
VLRAKVARTREPPVSVWNEIAGRGSGASPAVPRSVTVTSVASSQPPVDTTMNGRPGVAGAGCPEAGSVRLVEVTVTPCRRIRPLPV